MTTDPTRLASRPEVCEPAAGEPPVPASDVKLTEASGTKRLEALRFELDEGNNHWPDHMAAMIDEDYRQLMKDLGFH